MKYSKSAIHRKFHSLSELAFEDHRLTSFSGLIVFQALFAHLDLKLRLNQCFRHLKVRPIFGHGLIVMTLIIHLLLGYRQLRDMRYYHDDPLVKRTLGLTRLPDVATLSRVLASMDSLSADQVRRLNRDLVLGRLATNGLRRVMLECEVQLLRAVVGAQVVGLPIPIHLHPQPAYQVRQPAGPAGPVPAR